MRKIIVIGCPGSGKSVFSKKLNEITQIPLFHLDLLFWNSDKTTVERVVFLERLNQVMKAEQWIIDGNYNSTMELRMKECDTVIFLDYPLEICLDGVKERRGKPRSDMPWIETEEDFKFMEFIKSFNTQTRPKILDLLKKYSHKEIYIFKSRDKADDFLEKTHLLFCKKMC